jgi:hypothetical protein
MKNVKKDLCFIYSFWYCAEIIDLNEDDDNGMSEAFIFSEREICDDEWILAIIDDKKHLVNWF